MSLFPAYIQDEIETSEEAGEELDTPKEFGINFETGQLTGKIVEGVEAVKVWCYFALKVARYRYFICSWDYGSEIEELYGKGYSSEHIESEAARIIKECLLENEYIEAVRVSDANYQAGRFSAKITIDTIFGEGELYEVYEMEAA